MSSAAEQQRGVTRPQGTGCDIGAFELVPKVKGERFNNPFDLIVTVSHSAVVVFSLRLPIWRHF